MRLFKTKKSFTTQWFEDGGKEAILNKVKKYQGREIGSVYLSNFGLCPKGINYRELAALLSGIFPSVYWTSPEYIGQDDVILLIEAKGGVQNV